MELELQGKTAIITGASKGIGKAIALNLAEEGVNLAICARSKGPLESTAEAIRKRTGRKVFSQVTDMTDDNSVRNFVGFSLKSLGSVDILVNNAAAPGGLVTGPLKSADPIKLMLDIDTKVVGYLRAAKAVSEQMKKQGWGRIINIGGLAARTAGTISGMRNLALTHLTKTLSNELGPHGITVNIVHPGATRTERTKSLQRTQARVENIREAEVESRSISDLDVRRMIDASEIAYLVTFLASNKAAAITGESIAAGGGVGASVFH